VDSTVLYYPKLDVSRDLKLINQFEKLGLKKFTEPMSFKESVVGKFWIDILGAVNGKNFSGSGSRTRVDESLVG
jgi:hypothetical protein